MPFVILPTLPPTPPPERAGEARPFLAGSASGIDGYKKRDSHEF